MLKRLCTTVLPPLAALGFSLCLTSASASAADNVPAPTESAPLSQTVSTLVAADQVRLIELYKDLHAHPELGFMEQRTSALVAKQLKSLGFEVQAGIGGTGVLAKLQNGAGPVVMYRADMDGLPMAEATGLPYASQVKVKQSDGSETAVAHMCGHDAHVVWMLGMAKALAAMKDQWQGTLILVAQPAEELIAGADAMVKDGLYEKLGTPVPDYLLALHTAPIPLGMVVSRGGTMMSGSDQIDVTFHGQGGHGSMPHMTQDPVVMGAMAVTQYQTVVSRMNNPLDTAVLTVGAFQAGSQNNIIPNEALLKLNLRYFKPAVREKLISGITAINRGIATAYGVPEERMPTLAMKGSTTPLVNDAALLKRVQAPLKALLGNDKVMDQMPEALGSEDAHLLKGPHSKIPLAYMLVGVADPAVFMAAAKAGKPTPYEAHSPHYVVDLQAIPLGARIASIAALSLLAK